MIKKKVFVFSLILSLTASCMTGMAAEPDPMEELQKHTESYEAKEIEENKETEETGETGETETVKEEPEEDSAEDLPETEEVLPERSLTAPEAVPETTTPVEAPEEGAAMLEALAQTEIPVYEDGILASSDRIYYGQFDEKQEGILKLQDAKLKYYADGKFQSSFSGRLSVDKGSDYFLVSFYVKNGIVDTNYQGVVTICNTDSGGEGFHFYVVNGVISNSVFESDPDDPSSSMCSNATGLSIKNTTDGISVGYDKNKYGDDRGFYIYRLCKETGEFVFIAKPDGGSTGFVDKNVKNGCTYTYYIWTYSYYNMWNGGGYVCGFVDLSIVCGDDTSGKTNTFESFTPPDDTVENDLQWTISGEGVLTISGNGSMPDYDNNKNQAPWLARKTEIKSVVVQEGVTSIGEAAFLGCTDLVQVELASSVAYINNGAFCNCSSLENVGLGEGVRMIGDHAFEGTSSLRSIRLPASLGKISPLAFYNAGLEKYELSEESVFSCQDGVLFNGRGTILLSYPCKRSGNYTIPSGVTVIDKTAFQYAAVTSVEIPNSVKKIKKEAFFRSGIETLTIPDSVTEVGEFAVNSCTALKELHLGNGLKSLAYRFAEGCTSLESLTIPSSVEKIDTGAFNRCTSLKNVILKEGLKRIEDTAFQATALSGVDLPLSIVYIGRSAFPNNCSLNFPEDSKLTDLGGYYQRLYEAQIEAKYSYDMAFQVLDLVNQKRSENGQGALKMDEELLDAAMLRAAETSIYFEHTRPSGQSYTSVNSKVMGENIAAGNSTALSVMDSWMSSSVHKNNILGKDYAGIGIGCVQVSGTYYWVQLFSKLEADKEAGKKQDFSKVTTVLFDKDGEAGENFSVSVKNSRIKKEDKTDVLVRFNNGFRYTSLYPESIRFASSDQSVVTVSPKGEATGVAAGEAEVSACLVKEPEVCGTATITVETATAGTDQKPSGDGNQNPSGNGNQNSSGNGSQNSGYQDGGSSVKVSKLTISGLSKKIAAGKKVKLTVKVSPSTASKKVKWTSSNTKVATVSSAGIVTMKKKSGGRSVTITAKATDGSGAKATYKITSMKGVVKKITVSGKKSVKAGKTLKLKASVKAAKGANKTLKWKSSNEKYASVSSSGKVKSYKAGKGNKVKITAMATDGSGKKKSITIKIK